MPVIAKVTAVLSVLLGAVMLWVVVGELRKM